MDGGRGERGSEERSREGGGWREREAGSERRERDAGTGREGGLEGRGSSEGGRNGEGWRERESGGKESGEAVRGKWEDLGRRGQEKVERDNKRR